MFRFSQLINKTIRQCNRSYCLFGCGATTPEVPCTKISTLPNGMRVATEESNSPLTCVALFVEVGTVYEKPTNYGITHFVEHMAYRGFKSMGKQELDNYLVEIGAKMSVTTTREFQVFSGLCPAEKSGDIVCILSKIVTELELAQTEIDMAKCMIEIESYDAENNHKSVVSDFLHETAFQGTPLGRRIMGSTRSIKKMDKYAIDCYLKEFYYPARFVLATSGAVNHDNMVCSATTYFGKMDPTCGVLNNCPPQRFTGSQVTYRDDSMPFVHVAIAVEAPRLKSSDYLTMLLASNIIGSWDKSQGGDNRYGSPLARAAATSNICNSFESFYIPYRDVGLWGIYIVAEKMDIEDMIYNVHDRWMNLCTTTLFNDVERGINTTKLQLAKSIEGSVKSCYDIGIQMLYNCERRSLPRMFDALSRAKESTVKKIANECLYDRCPAVAAIGPVEALPDYSRIRAGMYWLRL